MNTDKVIRDTFNDFRGYHDFNLHPYLRFANGVEVFCHEAELEGIPSIYLIGQVAGVIGSGVALAYKPKEPL